MLIPVLLGVAGLVVVGIAYINRNQFADGPPWRRVAPYVLAAVLVVVVASGLAVAFANDHSTTGFNDPGSRGKVGQ